MLRFVQTRRTGVVFRQESYYEAIRTTVKAEGNGRGNWHGKCGSRFSTNRWKRIPNLINLVYHYGRRLWPVWYRWVKYAPHCGDQIVSHTGIPRRLVGRTVQTGSVPGQHFPEQAGFSAVPQSLCTIDRNERQHNARPRAVACFCVRCLGLDRLVSSDEF